MNAFSACRICPRPFIATTASYTPYRLICCTLCSSTYSCHENVRLILQQLLPSPPQVPSSLFCKSYCLHSFMAALSFMSSMAHPSAILSQHNVLLQHSVSFQLIVYVSASYLRFHYPTVSPSQIVTLTSIRPHLQVLHLNLLLTTPFHASTFSPTVMSFTSFPFTCP